MLEKTLNQNIEKVIQELYNVSDFQATLEKTPNHFEGDFTLVVFPLLRLSKKKPETTATEIGTKLLESCSVIEQFGVVKGFLNLTVKDSALADAIQQHNLTHQVHTNRKADTYLVEYSSPNTNKPLHLGHIRNNLLGYSISNILKEIGHQVKNIQIINDRGIHICKSMLAWQRFGNGETPESSDIKGDHFVGKFYVEYEKHYQVEIKSLIESGLSKAQAESQSTLNNAVKKMLQDWESGDPEIMRLWRKK